MRGINLTDVTVISTKLFLKGATLTGLSILCFFFISGVEAIYAQDQNLPSSNSSYSSAPTQKYSDSDEGDLGISPGLGIIAAIAVAASVAGGIMYVKRRNR